MLVARCSRAAPASASGSRSRAPRGQSSQLLLVLVVQHAEQRVVVQPVAVLRHERGQLPRARRCRRPLVAQEAVERQARSPRASARAPRAQSTQRRRRQPPPACSRVVRRQRVAPAGRHEVLARVQRQVDRIQRERRQRGVGAGVGAGERSLTGRSCSTEKPARLAQPANAARCRRSRRGPSRVGERIENSGIDDAGAPAPPLRLLASTTRAGAAAASRAAFCVERLAQHRPATRAADLVLARARRVGRLVRVGGVELEQPVGPPSSAGSLKVIGSWCAFSSTSRPSPTQPLAALVDHRDGVAAQHERQRRDPGLLPVLRRHLRAVGPQPGQVLRTASPRCSRPRRSGGAAATGCCCRSAIRRRVNSSSAARRRRAFQSNQESSLSWQ